MSLFLKVDSYVVLFFVGGEGYGIQENKPEFQNNKNHERKKTTHVTYVGRSNFDDWTGLNSPMSHV